MRRAEKIESVGGNRSTTIAGAHTQSFGAAHLKLVSGNRDLKCTDLTTDVGAAAIEIVGGSVNTKIGADQTLSAGAAAIFNGPKYTATAPDRGDKDGIKIEATILDATIGGISLSATGASNSTTGVSLSATGLKLEFIGVELQIVGLKTRVDAAHLQVNASKQRVGLIIKL